jgi:hypothetical protein
MDRELEKSWIPVVILMTAQFYCPELSAELKTELGWLGLNLNSGSSLASKS